MKRKTKRLLIEASPLIAMMTVLIGMLIYSFIPYSPKHKVGEWYEYMTDGNEFEKPKLIEYGGIYKVGTKNYLLKRAYCNLRGVEEKTVNFKWFDDDYKIVTLEQLKKDLKEQCK
jgi:hypothetical protein